MMRREAQNYLLLMQIDVCLLVGHLKEKVQTQGKGGLSVGNMRK